MSLSLWLLSAAEAEGNQVKADRNQVKAQHSRCCSGGFPPAWVCELPGDGGPHSSLCPPNHTGTWWAINKCVLITLFRGGGLKKGKVLLLLPYFSSSVLFSGLTQRVFITQTIPETRR